MLEWRFDPTSEAALRIADDDLQVIVLCQEGYTSSLAAAALQDIGVRRATDVVGGYAAWVADGVLPRRPPGSAPRDPQPRRVALADDDLGDALAVAVERRRGRA